MHTTAGMLVPTVAAPGRMGPQGIQWGGVGWGWGNVAVVQNLSLNDTNPPFKAYHMNSQLSMMLSFRPALRSGHATSLCNRTDLEHYIIGLASHMYGLSTQTMVAGYEILWRVWKCSRHSNKGYLNMRDWSTTNNGLENQSFQICRYWKL